MRLKYLTQMVQNQKYTPLPFLTAPFPAGQLMSLSLLLCFVMWEVRVWKMRYSKQLGMATIKLLTEQ